MQTREVKKLFIAKPTLEGAGVHLKRAFGIMKSRNLIRSCC